MSQILAPYIHVDELGEVWFYPTGETPQRLENADNLCGVLCFETGADDPLFRACENHDNQYRNRRFFEERGWTRLEIDELFLYNCLELAGDNVELQLRARRYFALVRLLGHIFYFRHEGAAGRIQHRAHGNSNIRRTITT